MRTLTKTRAQGTKVRRRMFAFMFAALLMASPAMAQIFMDDDLTNVRGWLGEMDEVGNIVPFQEPDEDLSKAGHAPVGSGMLVLTLLGGAYLLRKQGGEK